MSQEPEKEIFEREIRRITKRLEQLKKMTKRRSRKLKR